MSGHGCRESSPHADTTVLDELTYMLSSGSDRVAQLIFRHHRTNTSPASPNRQAWNN